MKRMTSVLAVTTAAILGLSACGGGSDPLDTSSPAASGSGSSGGGAVVIGSADFPESELLAEIYAGALKAKGIEASTKPRIGSREIYLKALEDGSIDLAWYGADGQPMQDWSSPDNRTLQMLVNGAWLGHESVLVVLHGGLHEQQLRLPHAPGLSAFKLLWDSVWERPERGDTVRAGEELTLAPLSLRTYAVTDPT